MTPHWRVRPAIPVTTRSTDVAVATIWALQAAREGATTAGVTKISPVATASPNHTTHAVPWTPGTVTQYETIVGGATAKPIGTARVTQGAVTGVINCSFNGGAL